MTDTTRSAPPPAVPPDGPATHAAEDLLAGGTQARIALGDQTYTLRLTRAGKLNPHQVTALSPSPPDTGLGATPVATLRAMGDMQAMAVMMRDGHSGPLGERRVRDVFVGTLGPIAGQAAADLWTDFARFLAVHARRPLMRHALGCVCVGADEAVVAHLLHLAATGAREDSMLILTLLVPADRALCAVTLAEATGLAVMRAARVAARRTEAPTATLH